MPLREWYKIDFNEYEMIRLSMNILKDKIKRGNVDAE